MKTKSDRKITAFAAFKPFVRILRLYKWEHFRNPDRRIIAQAIGFSILIFCLNAFVLTVAWHCYRHNFDVRQIALQIAILITLPTAAITYVSIGMKRKLVDNVIGNLNEIVNKRKTPISYFDGIDSTLSLWLD